MAFFSETSDWGPSLVLRIERSISGYNHAVTSPVSYDTEKVW
jgi:hypothetical protein